MDLQYCAEVLQKGNNILQRVSILYKRSNLFNYRYHLSVGECIFSEEEVRFICSEIACALEFLRSKKIVHRDVKPDNILLDERGHAHLTDFNVAAKLNCQGTN